MGDMLLDVQNLHKHFSGRKVVESVSFSVRSGQTLGLIGPNGAGKSTIVSIICGLLKADEGQVLLDGQVMGIGNNTAKQKVGLVPQDLAIYEELSAQENLALFGALYGLSGEKLKSRCADVLRLVNLLDRADEKPSRFSGGMKRRLNIAAALLHDPELLILDEPTVGVDPQSRNAIFDCLDALKKQGLALIYTSHYMEEVERLADQVIIIDLGKVIANETPAELYHRLPAQAALVVEVAVEFPAEKIQELKMHCVDVIKVELSGDGTQLTIALTTQAIALSVLNWLANQGFPALHFSTAKTNLEEIFLTLTGHSLRD